MPQTIEQPQSEREKVESWRLHVLIGRNRTELTLISTAPNVAQKVVAQADAQLARAMVARAT
jgi:hypothetical protein